MPAKRNGELESDSEKEETDRQWTDNTQSQHCAPLTHRFTSGSVVQPQTTLQGRPIPSTSQQKLQNTDHLPQKGKQTKVRFKCPKCNMGLCVDPDKI
jgi:hypothetical protein